MRRCFLLLVFLLAACNASTEATTTTTSATASSSAAPQVLIPGGLVPVDAATLVPFEDANPIVLGPDHEGVVSANGRWAAIRSEQTGGRDPLISIVDLDSLLVVADEEGSGDGLQVGDDGTAIWFDRGGLVELQITSEVTMVDTPPVPSYFNDTLAVFAEGRVAFLNGPSDEIGTVSIVIVDGTATTVHEVGQITSGLTGTDDSSIPHREFLVPDVAWDAVNDRAIVISADEDRLAVVDLDSGETSEHEFAASGSPGEESATRDAYVTDDGSTLFIATRTLDVSGGASDGDATEAAQQLVAVDTSDWSSRLVSATADSVYASPDGTVLATTGARSTFRGEGAVETTQSPVFLIDTATGEPLVGFEGRSGTIVNVQFSRDGDEIYVVSEGPEGTNIDIVDVASEQLAGSLGFERISLIGEAGLMSFHLED
jgi:hypothetical protein